MAANNTSGADGRAAWRSGAGEARFLQRLDGFASNEHGDEEPLAPAVDGKCRFEIFRADEERMTSTLFSGGDWRWRLVTTDGLVLAEAGGYPNEGLCRVAVSVLQKRAGSAAVVEGARR